MHVDILPLYIIHHPQNPSRTTLVSAFAATKSHDFIKLIQDLNTLSSSRQPQTMQMEVR